MGKSRLEAFSDGVIAIIITIMVLELKVPEGQDFAAIYPLIPVFTSYLLSFIFVGIYWNNHHHMIHVVKEVSGVVLWANLHLLFWLSLVPFATAWMGANHFAAQPVALYGFILLMAGVAFSILSWTLIRHQGSNPTLARAIGRNEKGKISMALYALAVPIAFFSRFISLGLYITVAFMWLIPDRRIEKVLKE